MRISAKAAKIEIAFINSVVAENSYEEVRYAHNSIDFSLLDLIERQNAYRWAFSLQKGGVVAFAALIFGSGSLMLNILKLSLNYNVVGIDALIVFGGIVVGVILATVDYYDRQRSEASRIRLLLKIALDDLDASRPA